MKEFSILQSSSHVFSLQSMETYAINLVLEGFAVIPVHSIRDGLCSCRKNSCPSAGKHPMTPNGSKDATRDIEKIRSYWQQNLFANIGIATGCEAGIVVLDVDKKNGGLESLIQLEAQHELLTQHRQAHSGGGGKHIYFLAPKGMNLKNKTGLLSGIDFRGEGGYIVAPPSIHTSGERYQWINQNPVQLIPQWLVDFVQGDLSRKVSLSRMADSSIKEGSRNGTLTSIAGFLKAKSISDLDIAKILPFINEQACQPPLSNQEVVKITQSLTRYPTITWRELRPLPTGKIKALPLTEDHLPHSLKNWVTDICQRMQIPLEFVAAPAIVALSAIIGRKIVIKPMVNDDWIVVPNTWGMFVGDPGILKTPALNQAMKPLTALEKKARSEFETACQEEAVRQKDMALEIESIKQSMKLDWSQGLGKQIEKKRDELKILTTNEGKNSLKEKRHKTNDPTIEKLAMILKDNPQGILLLRDELSGWLESLAKSGREGSREFFLEAWNGNGSFSFDRVGRGSLFVESICLSVFGGIQPERLKKFFDRYEDSHGQDGFVERFQIAVYPDPIGQWKLIDRKPDQIAYEQVYKLFESIDELSIPGEGPKTVEFTSEAQLSFYAWREGLEKRILSPDIDSMKKSYLSKYRSLMPSLALIFQVAEDAQEVKSVGSNATKMAIEWTRILESHMEKIMSIGDFAPESGAKKLLEKITMGEVYDGQSVRDIYRKMWKGLNTIEKVQNSLSILSEYGYTQLAKSLGVGRSSESILINPAVFEGGVQ